MSITKAIILLLLLAATATCNAMDGQLCKDSASLARDSLSRLKESDARLSYRYAFETGTVKPEDVALPAFADSLDVAAEILAMSNNAARLKQLLDAGLDPNIETSSGVSLLAVAADCGSTNAMRLLVAYGADIYAATETHFDAMSLAIVSDHEEAVDLLLESGYKVRRDTDSGRKLEFVARKAHGGRYAPKVLGERFTSS